MPQDSTSTCSVLPSDGHVECDIYIYIYTSSPPSTGSMTRTEQSEQTDRKLFSLTDLVVKTQRLVYPKQTQLILIPEQNPTEGCVLLTISPPAHCYLYKIF